MSQFVITDKDTLIVKLRDNQFSEMDGMELIRILSKVKVKTRQRISKEGSLIHRINILSIYCRVGTLSTGKKASPRKMRELFERCEKELKTYTKRGLTPLTTEKHKQMWQTCVETFKPTGGAYALKT